MRKTAENVPTFGLEQPKIKKELGPVPQSGSVLKAIVAAAGKLKWWKRDLPEDVLFIDSVGDVLDRQMCIMSATSYVAGEEFSDHPECASEIITPLCISLNDAPWWADAKDRTEVLKPLIPLLVGSRSTKEVEDYRAQVATHRILTVFVPAYLRRTAKVDPGSGSAKRWLAEAEKLEAARIDQQERWPELIRAAYAACPHGPLQHLYGRVVDHGGGARGLSALAWKAAQHTYADPIAARDALRALIVELCNITEVPDGEG